MIYYSIDIETTGLDPEKHQIIEFAAIRDDLNNQKPLIELPTFRAVFLEDNFIVSPFCAAMHHKLWQEIDNAKKFFTGRTNEQPVRADTAYVYNNTFRNVFLSWLRDHDNDKINIAGKNFGSFDLQFLKKVNFGNWYNYRFIDPANLFWQKGDTVLPGLAECKKRAGLPDIVDHTAIEDARDVIQLIRHQWNQT